MKTRSIQTLLLAATLGLLVTACNNDSDQTVDITKPINVKLSLTITGTNIPISRAAIGATEFDDDDALGLYAKRLPTIRWAANSISRKPPLSARCSKIWASLRHRRGRKQTFVSSILAR